MKILVLGGTGDAVTLANALADKGHSVTTALAGRTKNPARPKGKLITGGFGGTDGLAEYLKAKRIDYLIDATHPFAVEMSANAVAAATKTGVPLVRLSGPVFVEHTGANWWRVKDAEQAAARIPSGATAFLTLGRQTLGPFTKRPDVHFLVRSIEKPDIELPKNFKTIQARPPFSRADELALMKREGITHLVAKDSGSAQTREKLEAAFMLRIQVIMIERPQLEPCNEVSSVAEVEEIVAQLPPPRRRFFFFP
ncbi:MAG TPA: cobalt-precorrin-6A reductase [Devosia sp.]|nr:cobalt-precorrin-6A reductase [Devosia sp.]